VPTSSFRLQEAGDLPLVAAAVHDGHQVRPDVARALALSETDRLREEDPFTGEWTALAGTRIVGLRSRFEVDLNRPREKAVYRRPEDAWGLAVWRSEPPEDLLARSYAQYDAFYDAVRALFERMTGRCGRFVVYDLHSYNHRRGGPGAEPDDPARNPEVNLGTGTLDRSRWAPVVDRLLGDLRGFDYLGRTLDVRENVRFQGGYFAAWTHATFPASACVLSIELKKFFMDEWTGRPDREQVEAVRRALASTVPGVLADLGQL
jgi:N-formylglutamate amidohydrolase